MASSDLRSSRFIWWIRLAQLLFSIATLGIVANSTAVWSSLDCSIPQRVAYTLACASITLPFVIYLLFTTGRFERGFWWSWAQLGTDAFLAILWIAAAALSAPDCGDICNACSAGGSEVDTGEGYYVWSDSFYCSCYFPGIDYKKRSIAGKLLNIIKRGLLQPRRSSGGKVAETAASIGAKQGFEGVLIFFFVLTFIGGLSIWLGWSKKRYNAHPSHNASPEKVEEQPARHDQEVDTAGNVVEGLN